MNDSPSSSHFITTIDVNLASKLKTDLENQGFVFSFPPHTIFQAKKEGVSCTLYSSGKLMVQGKKKDPFIRFYLEPEWVTTLSYSYPNLSIDKAPHIGVDEAGKGDVFGPLCIAALYADGAGISKLVEMGIRDSKRLSDPTILKLADAIKKIYLFSIIAIFPKRYNELYAQFKNLNHLLGWGHATAIEKMIEQTPCKKVVIDQFASEHVVQNALKKKGIDLDLVQRHRGEDDVVVAGASILARAAFVQGIDRLSSQFALTLPKGASAQVIKAGKQFVFAQGQAALKEVAKLHFKTIKEFI